MRLGYACTNETLGFSVRELRLATLRAHGLPAVQALLDQNMASLVAILRWNHAHDIAMYRLPANLVPFGNHDEVDLGRLDFSGAREVPALARGMRLSVHPGHFTLVSAGGEVWARSRRDLAYHSTLFDTLGIEGDIVIHGGVYRDRAGTAARIERNIESLPDEVRRRLRLENDERSWPVGDLLPICARTATPLVVDNLHHALLNDGTPLEDLPWGRIAATWQGRAQGRAPKLHYSEQDPAKKAGAHSAYVDADLFRRFAAAIALDDFDVMLECKAKERALLRLRDKLSATTPALACD